MNIPFFGLRVEIITVTVGLFPPQMSTSPVNISIYNHRNPIVINHVKTCPTTPDFKIIILYLPVCDVRALPRFSILNNIGYDIFSRDKDSNADGGMIIFPP